MHRALLVVACLLITVGQGVSELLMVYSIQRHGARNVLPKTQNFTEKDLRGGPTLLPQGQRMCYNAGTHHNITCMPMYVRCQGHA